MNRKTYAIKVRMTEEDHEKLKQISALHGDESLSATVRKLIRHHRRPLTLEEAREKAKRAHVAGKALRIGLLQLIEEGDESARDYLEWETAQAIGWREIYAREGSTSAPILVLWEEVQDEP